MPRCRLKRKGFRRFGKHNGWELAELREILISNLLKLFPRKPTEATENFASFQIYKPIHGHRQATCTQSCNYTVWLISVYKNNTPVKSHCKPAFASYQSRWKLWKIYGPPLWAKAHHSKATEIYRISDCI